MSPISRRLADLGVTLPTPAAPVANYVPFVQTGGSAPGALPQLWVSGQLPLGTDGRLAEAHKGKLRPDSSPDAAREAARLAAINVLAQAKAALGELDRVVRVVKLAGFFSVEGGFDALPLAMNGASDLMVEVFGERGRHARSTVGVAHLPMGALAEVEAVFEVSS